MVNGGLIILPKLLRYLWREVPRKGLLAEAAVRIHYLLSPTLANAGVLILLLYSFELSLRNYWLPLTALPYFALYGRDMVLLGYKWWDLLRVYALNLLLIPVNLGGVVKSLQQAVTGRQTPFGRTPKVVHRTATWPCTSSPSGASRPIASPMRASILWTGTGPMAALRR